MTRHFAALALLCASSALASQRPSNFDAVASAAPAAQRRSVRVTAARATAGFAAVPTQWHERFDVPTFVWFGGSSDGGSVSAMSGARESAENVARQQLFANAPLYGLGFSDVAGAYVANLHDTGRGAIVVKFRQRIDGVEVFRDELNVVLTREHALLAMSGYLAPSSLNNSVSAASAHASATAWQVGENDAIVAALRDFDPALDIDPRAMRTSSGGDFDVVELPEWSDALPRPARVKRVWFHLPEQLEPAYYLELDVADRNTTGSEMFAYVISAIDGRVLWRKNLSEDAGTAFRYRVWADPDGAHRPLNGPQGFGGAPNPTGTFDGFQAPFTSPVLMSLASAPFSKGDPWLSSAAVDTNGNNADAYADLNSPDGFNSGRDLRAAVTAPNTFDYTYDLGAQPDASAAQRSASITQLFYTVNWLHDVFYDSGFDESAGNAQASNFERGGLQGDAIRAESQDYSGRNNANMSTPADGGRPRMQMYIFDGIAARTLTVSSPPSAQGEYATGIALFGATSFDVNADVVSVIPSDGCATITSNVAGKIAFIDRGNCGFQVKAESAKAAGAAGVIIGNVASSPSPSSRTNMSCTVTPCSAGAPALPPSFHVAIEDADRLRAALSRGTVRARLKRDPAIDRDGSLDAEVVAHEWGHYLSNRLISNAAGLTSTQSRGMGEGWSDFNSLLLIVRPEDAAVASNATFNGVYGEGNFVTSGGSNGPVPNGGYYFGIRRVPYSTTMTIDPLTLRHIANGNAISGAPVAFGADGGNNAEVHATGEVWATMLWELYASLLRDTLGSNPRLTFAEAQKRMRDYLVASLKMTPPDPTFLDARNALLAAAFARDNADYQNFWNAFAKRGAGVLATAGDRYSSTNLGTVENFSLGNAVSFAGASLDDSVTGCNKNGILDGGESGLLKIDVRNSGNGRLEATTARVTSNDSRLTFENNGSVTIPESDPGQTVSATIKASLSAATDMLTPSISIALTDPQLTLQPNVVSTFSPRMNAHDEPKTSTADDVEGAATAWTITSAAVGANAATNTWSRLELAPAQHVWRSAEPLRATDSSLVSPPLLVGPDGILTMTFRHRYAFDFTVDAASGLVTNIDGGVIELSVDGGKSWSDIGAAARPGYAKDALLTSNGNPLEGRLAFAGESAGWKPESPSSSPFITSTLSVGALANKSVRVRFRIGTGGSHATIASGWQIDDVAFVGLANLPFNGLAADRGLCGTGDTTTALKSASVAGTSSSVVPLEATVSSNLATPSGSVEFLENGVVIGASLLVGGKATFDAGRLTPGTHSIVASFVGTTNFKPSQSSAATVSIGTAPRRHTVRH
jgi:hypothetical protein